MNIFSNIGITELVVILLLALIVVGPERLPALARQAAQVLRDLRKAYENLTKDIGPELMSIQQTTQELRESVQAVRTIPQDMVKSVVKAADLDSTVRELKEVADSVGDVGQIPSAIGKSVAGLAEEAVRPKPSVDEAAEAIVDEPEEERELAQDAEVRAEPEGQTDG